MACKDDPRQRLFQRHADNPLLTAFDWPYFINTVFNPGACRLPSGDTLLLCRVEDCSGRSHFCAARSANGKTKWKIDPHPTLVPDVKKHPEEQWGIEDPRVVWVPELDHFAITYTCYSPAGPGVMLALTKDFKSFERMGNIMPPDDKDAALLPRKIKDRWALIHRPSSGSGMAHIWISYSPDLKHWGEHEVMIEAKRGPWWDSNKVGLSPPAIETPEGWLILYHGVRHTPAGCLYRLGVALQALEDPEHTLYRGDKWIMGPEREYERHGDVGYVVFPCGYTIDDDGDTLNLYYGAADTSICLAHASIADILDWLKHSSSAKLPVPGDVGGQGEISMHH